MILLRRIKASALYFALFAATLIALLLSSFLLLSKTQRIFQIKNNNVLSSLEAVTDGLEEALSEPNLLQYSYAGRNVSVSVDSWGGFMKIAARDTTDTFGLTMQSLVGGYLPDNASIVLADNFLPLVVAGDARIEGTAYLPERGIQSAAIGGVYYRGDQLIYGPYKNVSSMTFPKLDKTWLESTQDLASWMPTSFSLQSLPAELKISFNEESRKFFFQDPVRLNQKLSGNIIVKSVTELYIQADAEVMDAVMIAPKITIEEGFNGRIHAVATDSIVVERNTKLDYPSSLVLLDESKEEMTGSIVLQENAQIAGNLIYHNPFSNNESLNANIFIDNNVVATGSVYSNGAVELLGNLNGSMVVQYTIANQRGQRYRNYIYNGQITTTDLPKKLAGLPFSNHSKAVATWLY